MAWSSDGSFDGDHDWEVQGGRFYIAGQYLNPNLAFDDDLGPSLSEQYSSSWKEAARGTATPHPHCDYCIVSSCAVRENDCPAASCPGGCGASLHRCKLRDHLELVCPEQRVPCTNACNGCPARVKRRRLVNHIQHCPASVLLCRHAYERTRGKTIGKRLDAVHLPPPGPPATTLLDDALLKGDKAVALASGVPPDQSAGLGRECRSSSLVIVFQSSVPLPRPRQRVGVADRGSVTFACNEVVRRDEFSAHWKSLHIDIQGDTSTILQRCPMVSYGCPYGANRLVPRPHGTVLRYDPTFDICQVCPPETVDSSRPPLEGEYAAKILVQQELAMFGYGGEDEGSADYLGQLPVEVLEGICKWLDSQSLWCLSLANHYLRKVCYGMVRRHGTVYFDWEHSSDGKSWVAGPWVRLPASLPSPPPPPPSVPLLLLLPPSLSSSSSSSSSLLPYIPSLFSFSSSSYSSSSSSSSSSSPSSSSSLLLFLPPHSSSSLVPFLSSLHSSYSFSCSRTFTDVYVPFSLLLYRSGLFLECFDQSKAGRSPMRLPWGNTSRRASTTEQTRRRIQTTKSGLYSFLELVKLS